MAIISDECVDSELPHMEVFQHHHLHNYFWWVSVLCDSIEARKAEN